MDQDQRRVDGVIDFDRALRDPGHPLRLLPAYDSGDHLHPNDADMAAMADALPLRLFRRANRSTVDSRRLKTHRVEREDVLCSLRRRSVAEPKARALGVLHWLTARNPRRQARASGQSHEVRPRGRTSIARLRARILRASVAEDGAHDRQPDAGGPSSALVLSMQAVAKPSLPRSMEAVAQSAAARRWP